MRYARNTLLTGLIVMGALSWSCVRNLPPVAPQSAEADVDTGSGTFARRQPPETPNRAPARAESSAQVDTSAATTVSQIGPTNDLPNPYTTIVGWAKMPGSRTWGSTSAVDIDPDGKHIWVAERCEANACEGSTLDPVLKFDESGHLINSFGAGLMNWPHGFYVHDDGSVWVTDARGGDGKGHQVHKFSPNGDLLLSLGTAGVAGTDGSHFNQPSDVVVGPDGSIYVGDGHGGESNARIVKFDAAGNFVKAWGEPGTAPGQFGVPHGLAFDSQGRLFVADRSNNRIQIFDQDGNFLEEWHQFSRLSGIFIDDDDMLFGTDSESNHRRGNGEWRRGMRVGSARTGEVLYFIPDPADPNDGPLRGTSFSEGVAVDAAGNIYGAEVGPKGLKKYVRREQ